MDRREQVLKVTDALQDYGDVIAVGGYAATITVAGAPVGIPTALVGNTISAIGAVGGIGTNLLTGNFKEAGISTAFMITGGVITRQIEKISSLSNFSKEFLQQNFSLKNSGVERLTTD